MSYKNNFIIPCLWFDSEGEEAVKFYTSLFEKSSIKDVIPYGKEGFEYHHKPEGSPMTIEFELNGQSFIALNGGPDFKHNESVSLFVYCATEDRINFLYDKLKESGSILMPLDKYEWSTKYAWVKDQFGVSWQLDIEDVKSDQKIIPSLLFVNDKYKAIHDAISLYTSIFPNSEILERIPANQFDVNAKDYIAFAQLSLNGYLFNLMSGGEIQHNFDFNEAFSFIVNCESQDQIDYYWEKLTSDGIEIQCGWLKDKFGVSWQVVPDFLNSLLKNPQKRDSVMKSILEMKKIEIEKLLTPGD